MLEFPQTNCCFHYQAPDKGPPDGVFRRWVSHIRAGGRFAHRSQHLRRRSLPKPRLSSLHPLGNPQLLFKNRVDEHSFPSKALQSQASLCCHHRPARGSLSPCLTSNCGAHFVFFDIFRPTWRQLTSLDHCWIHKNQRFLAYSKSLSCYKHATIWNFFLKLQQKEDPPRPEVLRFVLSQTFTIHSLILITTILLMV